jgi:hypothetical protein
VLQLNETLENGFVGLVVSLVGTYLIAAWKGATILDAARETESQTLRKTIEQLTPPNRTAEQDQKSRKVQMSVQELGPGSLIALQHLDTHERITFRASFGSPLSSTGSPLPVGMNNQEFRLLLDQCAEKSLVSRDQSVIPTGAPYPTAEETYRIAKGMEAAIKELLYPPVPVISSRP